MAVWLPSLIAGIAAIVAAFCGAWSAVKVAKINANIEEKKEQHEKEEKRRKEEEAYKEALLKRIELLEEAIELLKTSNKCLLRGDIIRTYNHYIGKHYIPIYGMQNVDEEFKLYEKFNGNGTVPELVVELKKLPHEPPN